MNTKTTGQTYIFKIRMVVDPDSVDILLDAMAFLEPAPGSWQDVDTGEVWIEAYCTAIEEANTLASQIEDIAESVCGKKYIAVINKMENADWTENWKKFFPVVHVTDRVVVRPVWQEYTAAPGEVVVDIEPGMSFGTGLHQTTQSCIRLIQTLAEAGGSFEREIIDMGCGSGILSIAAAKLGFKKVSGYDNDPLAVATARQNAQTNGLDIVFAEGDVLKPVAVTADIIVANILAPVLIKAVENLRNAVNPGGNLILSGILNTQYEEIRRLYIACGFREEKSLLHGEWRTGLFSRPSANDIG
jgi:ribosomal protein L11 methyltransferase